jgi:hypothetical protein
MLGLSFGKILLIVLVIVVAWRGLRIYHQLQARLADREASRAPSGGRSAPRATDLVECPRCGTFVPNGTFCPSVEQCRYRRAS